MRRVSFDTLDLLVFSARTLFKRSETLRTYGIPGITYADLPKLPFDAESLNAKASTETSFSLLGHTWHHILKHFGEYQACRSLQCTLVNNGNTTVVPQMLESDTAFVPTETSEALPDLASFAFALQFLSSTSSDKFVCFEQAPQLYQFCIDCLSIGDDQEIEMPGLFQPTTTIFAGRSFSRMVDSKRIPKAALEQKFGALSTKCSSKTTKTVTMKTMSTAMDPYFYVLQNSSPSSMQWPSTSTAASASSTASASRDKVTILSASSVEMLLDVSAALDVEFPRGVPVSSPHFENHEHEHEHHGHNCACCSHHHK